jgi:hypothetical protein
MEEESELSCFEFKAWSMMGRFSGFNDDDTMMMCCR